MVGNLAVEAMLVHHACMGQQQIAVSSKTWLLAQVDTFSTT